LTVATLERIHQILLKHTQNNGLKKGSKERKALYEDLFKVTHNTLSAAQVEEFLSRSRSALFRQDFIKHH
jgi:hypothetical protein